MNAFELYLVEVGCSWQLAKLLPFISAVSIGAIAWYNLRRKIPTNWLKLVFLIVFTTIPFFTYFIFSPIYRGDFTCQARTIPTPLSLKKEGQNTLYVVAIPGCKFCAESVGILSVLKKQNPSLSITYLVLSHNQNDLDKYQAIASAPIQFKSGDNFEELTMVSEGKFPTFLLKKNGKIIRWSNSEMGPAVLDYLRK